MKPEQTAPSAQDILHGKARDRVRRERLLAGETPLEPSGEEVADRLIQELHSSGLRRTKTLQLLVRALVAQSLPMTLKEICELPGLDECHPVTIYRNVMKLVELDVVRRRSLQGRSVHFQLLPRNTGNAVLICIDCGDVHEVARARDIEVLEESLVKSTGWENLRLEMELVGYCPDCARKPSPGAGSPMARGRS